MTGKGLPKVKYTLLCDDIREEKSNKAIIIGLYSSKIILGTLPSLLSKLCFRICFDISMPFHDTFNLIIKKPNRTIMGPFPVNVPRITDETQEVNLNVAISPFPIEETGVYEVIAEHGGKEEKIHRFFVEQGAAPSADPEKLKH